MTNKRRVTGRGSGLLLGVNRFYRVTDGGSGLLLGVNRFQRVTDWEVACYLELIDLIE